MKTVLKQGVRNILRLIDTDLESRMVDQYHFSQLKRKPPELMWKALRPGPVIRLDAGGLQLGHELYVFAGYRTGDDVLSDVDVFDMREEKWTTRFKMPPDMPQSHLGMVCDRERYMYSISGQLGNQCHPAVGNCFVLDTKTKEWNDFPPLPEPRYAATISLWRGRIHALGGSKQDRNTPGTDHWSIAVKDGKALENEWRREPSILRGGPHRASVAVNDRLFVFGGQEGDYVPIPGDPKYMCTGDLTCEEMFGDVYMLAHGESEWKRMADMPVKSSHTEFTPIIIGKWVVVMGGQYEKDPQTKIIQLTDAVQAYNTVDDTWKVIGRLPYRTKSVVTGYYNGYLYFTTGQRDKGVNDPTPGDYDHRAWKAKFSL